MTLFQAQAGQSYHITAIETSDPELNAFLGTLGCYPGAAITLVKRRSSGCVVRIQGSRYNLDPQLAQCIIL